MFQLLLKLSVASVLISYLSMARADSFLLPVSASSCVLKEKGKTSAEIYTQAYDKAAFLAVKSSDYMQKVAKDLDDHNYNKLAYRLIDNALGNVSVSTVLESEAKMCLELSGILDKQKADKILEKTEFNNFNPDDVERIAQEVTIMYPSQPAAADNLKPLVYIEELLFHNQTRTSDYTQKIREQLAFEPSILVTEKKELADFLIRPKVLQSSLQKLDNDKSRFSMSLVLEITNEKSEIIASERQNRYIIINNSDNTQEIARKLLIKLIKEALETLSGTFKNLRNK